MKSKISRGWVKNNFQEFKKYPNIFKKITIHLSKTGQTIFQNMPQIFPYMQNFSNKFQKIVKNYFKKFLPIFKKFSTNIQMFFFNILWKCVGNIFDYFLNIFWKFLPYFLNICWYFLKNWVEFLKIIVESFCTSLNYLAYFWKLFRI